MKFSGKMCLKIILKVTKNQGFILYLEDTFLENPHGGGGGGGGPGGGEEGKMKLSSLSRFSVNEKNFNIFCNFANKYHLLYIYII